MIGSSDRSDMLELLRAQFPNLEVIRFPRVHQTSIPVVRLFFTVPSLPQSPTTPRSNLVSPPPQHLLLSSMIQPQDRFHFGFFRFQQPGRDPVPLNAPDAGIRRRSSEGLGRSEDSHTMGRKDGAPRACGEESQAVQGNYSRFPSFRTMVGHPKGQVRGEYHGQVKLEGDGQRPGEGGARPGSSGTSEVSSGLPSFRIEKESDSEFRCVDTGSSVES